MDQSSPSHYIPTEHIGNIFYKRNNKKKRYNKAKDICIPTKNFKHCIKNCNHDQLWEHLIKALKTLINKNAKNI